MYFANWSDAILRSLPVLEYYIGNCYCSSTITWVALITKYYVKNTLLPPILQVAPPSVQRKYYNYWVQWSGMDTCKAGLGQCVEKKPFQMKLSFKQKVYRCYPGNFFSPPPGYSTLHLTDMALNKFITLGLQSQKHWMQYFKGNVFSSFAKELAKSSTIIMPSQVFCNIMSVQLRNYLYFS